MIRGEFDGSTLVLHGEGPVPDAVTLEGRRARVAGTVTADGAAWTATVPLTAARWGGPPRPLPTGDYRLVLSGVEGADAAASSASVPLSDLSLLRAELDGTRLRVAPPVDPAAAADAERAYAEGRGPVTDAVFFESFYGRNASCNPLALDREIARVAPEITRYWSVVDLSVAVPEGAVAVIEGSPEWWHARGVSRLLIVNDWLRRRFVRRPGQLVLQTWHGTPLKRLALHRPGFDPRRAAAVLKERARWDVLLAQNPYSVRTLARAYAFGRKPVWVEGYPRNDVLVSDVDGAAALAARAALGVGPDERVLLYAPTWRDDREEIVDFLDAERLAADTGAVVLVRGHSRTLQPGRDAAGDRVIDVTSFPDLTQLLLAADALITDYSSVMFDFSATGKPMYFFVPDLDHYRGRLRGFYFDLAERAPGPVVATQADLTEALAAEDDGFAGAYAAWRATFNARDDGRASERVVARLLDRGFLVAD